MFRINVEDGPCMIQDRTLTNGRVVDQGALWRTVVTKGSWRRHFDVGKSSGSTLDVGDDTRLE